MKTNKKQLLSALVLGVVIVILFVGGCKKDISTSGDVVRPDVIMGTGGKELSTKVVRQSPGLKIQATGQKIDRISRKLRHPEKLEAILKELSKKKKNPGITVSDATFSASLSGSVYNCSIDFPDLTGDKEFWLVNTLTWVYTYASASSTSYATFNVNKPLLPGTYRVYGEDAYSGTQYSNEITLGDAYSGISINSGIIAFTNVSAYDALVARLRNAYETHQTWLDNYNLLSSDDAEAQAISDGFDEFLPYKEFEAHFGLSSLRAQIRGEVEYWQTQYNEDGTGYPEDNYIPYSYEQQTLMNTEGQIEVGGVGEGPMTLPLVAGGKNPPNPGPNTCMDEADMAEHRDYDSNKKVKMYVWIDPVSVDGGGNSTVFSGRTRTMRRTAGFWFDRKERQQIRVSGTQFLSCSAETTFDSGLKNTANFRRYMMDVDYSAGPGRQGKSGFVTTSITLTDWTMTPYTLTYTH